MDRQTLNKIKQERLPLLSLRQRKVNVTSYEKEVVVCSSSGCFTSTGIRAHDKLVNSLKEKGLADKVKVTKVGCLGICSMGPIMIVFPDNVMYVHMTPEDIDRFIDEHLVGGKVLEDKLYSNSDMTVKQMDDLEFYSRQMFIARLNREFICPEDINDYIAIGGYESLAKVLEMKPEEVVALIKDSGLRGRGGGGFLTGLKWELAAKNESDEKYVVCNADEGDPGAFMDRSIIEHNPQCIIEAMAIAGYAIGAKEGYIYVRAEYALACKRLEIAIEQAKELGLLGSKLFGSDFEFNLHIKKGAGAFVCGEETALIHSVEGNRGEPTLKPPYPAESGLFNKPTVVNNVETLANIPVIIRHGVEWFKGVGSVHNGTKVFALSGKIKYTGLVEMPMGTTIREIVYGIGGGAPNNKPIKAVQLGGPSGGCICEKDFDTPINYDSLKQLGSMMGSGGMIVMDEDTCMVDLAKFFLGFTCDESCGKCTPCRIGTKRIYEILDRITQGKGELEDLDKLRELCHFVKANSLCGLGQSAPNPVLSTLDNFIDEYKEHIINHTCPAHVCQALVRYEINKDKCVGCTLCNKKCPVNAITGNVKEPQTLHQDKCIKCGNCYKVCRFNAVERR